MSEEAARDRIAAQIGDEERDRAATFVLSNNGSKGELEAEIDRLWAEIAARARPN
jgi:dephospho-CoA kinase